MKNNNNSRKDRLKSKRQAPDNYWIVCGEELHISMRNCEYIKELNKDGHVSQRNPMTKDYKIVDGLKEFVE